MAHHQNPDYGYDYRHDYDHTRDRIPEKYSRRAPPPPRPIEQPPPKHTKSKRITRKMINKSQVRAAVLMIIFVIFFIIIIVLSTFFHTQPTLTKTMEQDVNPHSFGFTVPDLLSQKIPVVIDVKASDDIYFFVLKEEDYQETLNFEQLSNLSLNGNSGITNHFHYERNLEPGEYVVVSYKRYEVNHDITLKFSLIRFVLKPFLWLFSVIFILLILICIIRIGLLQRKKSKVHDEPPKQPIGGGMEHYPETEYPQIDYHDRYAYEGGSRSQAGPGPGPDYAQRPPHRGAYPPQPPGAGPEAARGAYPETMHRPLRRPPHRPPSDHYGPGSPDQPPPYAPPGPAQTPPPHPSAHGPKPNAPVTIPCKCGEIIVISDPTRPIRIQCPRCGRRGILEGKKAEPEPDIFY